MEDQFVWKEEFNIGVESIDKEHQQLFRIINKLFELEEQEKDSQWACEQGIKFFKNHALKHFINEEEYMESINYEGLQQHRRIHAGFRENTLPALEKELERTGYSPDAVEHFRGVCAGWLIGHTLTEDLAITGKAMGQWDNLLSYDDMKAMEKVIVQLVFDMFHLESHLVSDSYSGEKFGKGIYYRLVYEDKKNEKSEEIFLIFEEQLLINTVGKALGIQTNKLDTMLAHATRYTSRQFVNRVMEHIETEEEYELVEENFLSYTQFQKVFKEQNLQMGLLFDTGAGYFAYCSIAPRIYENGVAVPIGAENAMTEVEKYLMKREVQEGESGKLKILIVDDSMTLREGIRQLLCEDYEVAVAESGIAAIRTITLNRPDLVLLDYEMPVCDGKQTLEMLRSDKMFADLPVIFLTGRRDPKSMIEVMSLNPAGYLLKTLTPQEIKKEIDTFFEKRKK